MQTLTKTPIATCSISFPDLDLPRRQAHWLRGYLGRLFEQHSPLLHNHYADGSLRYRYPQVQYKIIDGLPLLLGLHEGAELLHTLFLQIKELQLGEQHYTLSAKKMQQDHALLGLSESLHRYQFVNPWLGLNERNYARYQKASAKERQELLQKILVGNILSFYKGMGLRLAAGERILLSAQLKEKAVKFKNQRMLAFTGIFTTNALLPTHVGLGKSVSRGFGTLQSNQ